jgi:hypothetical protein
MELDKRCSKITHLSNSALTQALCLVNFAFWEAPAGRPLPTLHQDGLYKRSEVNVTRRLNSDKSYLVKVPVEENGAAYWNKLLILHEMIKCLLMKRVPILQQRDSLPKERVEFSQSARWEV